MIKKTCIFITTLISLNLFAVEPLIFDSSLLVDEIKYTMINMGFELITTDLKAENISYTTEIKNNYIKIFNINDPYQGIFFPINLKELKLLFNITPYFIKVSKLTENVTIPFSSQQDSISIIPKFSTYVNTGSYYFELTLLSKLNNDQPDSEINISGPLGLNLYENKKTKFYIPYIRLSVIKDFNIFKTGITLSNFIKIDKEKNGLNTDDLYEVTPYLIHNVFTNQFYRFNEVYETCYFVWPSMQYAKEYGHDTSIYKINPKITFNVKNITITGNLIFNNVKYKYHFYDYSSFQAQREGDFKSMITNININIPLGKYTRLNLKLEKNIFSKLSEKFEYDNEDTKLEYNYDTLGINVYQDSELGYELGINFLRLTGSLELIQLELYYSYWSNPFFNLSTNNLTTSPERVALDTFAKIYIKLSKKIRLNLGSGIEIFKNDPTFMSYSLRSNLGTELNFSDLSIKLEYNLNLYFAIKNITNIFMNEDIKGPEHNILFNIQYRL